MKTKNIQLLFVLLCAATVFGCSTNYTPPAEVPKLTEIADIPTGTKVVILNAQSDTKKINISQSGISLNVYANLHDWTDQLVRGLTRTLQKKGVTVGGDSPKTLKVAITKAALSMAGGGWSTRTTIVCTVDIGNGEPITLGGEDTGYKWQNGCEGAMRHLVTAMLNDERIQKFMATP